MTNDVLVVTGLSKRFGSGPGAVQANDAVDLTVHAGQVVCLLGHNGAGKSTLVNQVVGLTLPDAGTVVLDGVDAVADPARARALASVQAQANVPITGLTPRTAIALVGRIRGLRKADALRRADELLTALDLQPWADRSAEKVSGGVARLTAFAMAAVAPGRLVVLDEPTNDVDPVRRRLLWAEIRRIADASAGILLVTHNIHEAEHVVDDVVLLDAGRVVAHGTPAALVAAHPGDTLEDVYIRLVGHEPPPGQAATVPSSTARAAA
ncbi:ABC transporter ATP-binding protein [Xylanimonas protaetiae]|uniref:ABC transporter ATP-binding protein n=1 Tax=Xylanimonas protaetiae TaxID=2509457 RepID=A0A4P6F6T0_9MICO|nr:ABC transporter ATP-binding protein [Xylanimonas protaetiae]QAY71155.1 ABC transporter ATP-binding protein [Xylanimonas protaetiae]